MAKFLLLSGFVLLFSKEVLNQHGYPNYNFPYTQPQRFSSDLTGLPKYQTGFSPYYPQPGGYYSPFNAYQPYVSSKPYRPGQDCLSKGKILPCSSLPTDDPDRTVRIIDVSPEYHQRLLGLNTNIPQQGQYAGSYQAPGQSSYSTNYGVPRPGVFIRRPKYKVEVETKNVTYAAPKMVTFKPIIRSKTFNTTLKRTIVYDPNKPQKPINLTFVNGVLITEKPQVVPPLSLTENSQEEEKEEDEDEDEYEETITTTTEIPTTTENEKPDAVGGWWT